MKVGLVAIGMVMKPSEGGVTSSAHSGLWDPGGQRSGTNTVLPGRPLLWQHQESSWVWLILTGDWSNGDGLEGYEFVDRADRPS